MSSLLAEDRIAELDRKLDFIVEEIANLKRVRNSAEDLLSDLSLVGKSAMGDAVEAFGTADLRPHEIVRLLRTALANARLFESAILQLQSAADFIQDAQPIVRDAVSKVMAAAESLERQGYMTAVKSGVRVGHALIQSHTANDWEQVEVSVPQLVGFLRELTKPEVLGALEAIIHDFGRVQATMDANKSVFTIARDLNSPDARHGIAIMVEFLKVVGAHIAPASSSQSYSVSTSQR